MYVGDKQLKINFVTEFDPSFPDIGRLLRKHAHIRREDEQCDILFPDKCFRVAHRRGHKNLTLSHLGDLIHSQPGGDGIRPPSVTLLSLIQIKPNLLW